MSHNTGWNWITEQALPSDLDAGHHFINEVLSQLEQLHWEGPDLFAVNLAIEEAVVNAIKHGNKLNSQKHVSVSCKISARHFWIHIADEGEGFNPAAVPDCTDEKHIDAPCGRGLLLMRSYMNLIEYNDRGNAVTMAKERKAVAPS